jgi:hypothetical protein
MTDEKDAFDRWWDWAEKPHDSTLTIPSEMHDAVMTLTPDERRDRALVNQVVREGQGPLRSAGSADQYGVPTASE